jgi:hypothetical protein
LAAIGGYFAVCRVRPDDAADLAWMGDKVVSLRQLTALRQRAQRVASSKHR